VSRFTCTTRRRACKCTSGTSEKRDSGRPHVSKSGTGDSGYVETARARSEERRRSTESQATVEERVRRTCVKRHFRVIRNDFGPSVYHGPSSRRSVRGNDVGNPFVVANACQILRNGRKSHGTNEVRRRNTFFVVVVVVLLLVRRHNNGRSVHRANTIDVNEKPSERRSPDRTKSHVTKSNDDRVRLGEPLDPNAVGNVLKTH